MSRNPKNARTCRWINKDLLDSTWLKILSKFHLSWKFIQKWVRFRNSLKITVWKIGLKIEFVSKIHPKSQFRVVNSYKILAFSNIIQNWTRVENSSKIVLLWKMSAELCPRQNFFQKWCRKFIHKYVHVENSS